MLRSDPGYGRGVLAWPETIAGSQGLQCCGIVYLDLSPLLAGKDGITFEIDPPYNQRGHALIAEGLTEAIFGRYGNNINGGQEH